MPEINQHQKNIIFVVLKKERKKVSENKRKTISGNKVTLAAVDDAKKNVEDV